MSGLVVPFPAARRRLLVWSIGRRALELGGDTGERHIGRSLELQAAVMRRKGIAAELVARDLAALDAAVRNLMWAASPQPRERR